VILRTFEGLQALTTQAPRWASPSGGSSLHLYDRTQSYDETYRSEPIMRTVIDFLARNIAHVPPQAFRRVSDTDRVRLPHHDLVRWLSHPNPGTTRYRLFEDLMTDLGIYYRAYWAKVRTVGADGREAIGLVRLPPDEITVDGVLIPANFRWTVNGRPKDFAPTEIVHFCGYKLGISLFETMRRILAEESAAGDHRESFWRNASRQEGVIEQAIDAPAGKWNPDQKNMWRDQWQARHTGRSTAGQVALLEPGWTFKADSFSAKDSESTAGQKQRREMGAALGQTPQPFVGILDHATFSNIKEQHKNLYQDCLGPWFEMIRQELHRQLLTECEDQLEVYLEFNIDAKMAGTPEERADSIQRSTGRPWRTVNEARALENLPRIDDPELDTVAPQQGGPSDATANPGKTAPMFTKPDAAPGDARTVETVLEAHRKRQRAKLEKLPATARAYAFFAELDRWNQELADDLTPLVGDAAGPQAFAANLATFSALDTEAAA
jgi:HK97 family phage portal protein